MKLCMGCMNEIEDHLSTCPYCGFNETTLRQESYYLDPGTIIGGKYIVGRVLSYGGHTVSYMGMDAEMNRKVIVKEYLPSDFSTRSEGEKDVTIYSGDGQEQFEQGLTNFLNEANRIQQLQNAKGIAKVYDCLAENETGYVISEYVEGRTLKEILDSGKRYSAEEAADFIRQILAGLADVHRMDIVHCDISPETIMVTDSGEIKLTDFGATRYVTTANSKSLSIILKRGYAPEEQYRSKGVRGPWTDVYALGAVMYLMITGEVPQESVERALSDDLKEPSKMGIDIPKNIENALMNALNVYQQDRTQSAEAFLQELNSSEVKRRKVKQQKNKTGKFPIWAKALVAGLACVVVVGGVYMIKMTKGGNGSLDNSGEVVMMDLRNKNMEEADEAIKNLNKENNWDLTLETENQFNKDTDQEGIIFNQSVTAGEVLKEGTKKETDTKESASESTEELTESESEALPKGLTKDKDGKLTGKIKLKVYTHEKVSYSELKGLSAYAIAQKLGIETKPDSEQFIPVNKGGDHYYDLIRLEAGGQEITKDQLESDDHQEDTFAYSDDLKIFYYETDFFYWEKLPDFASKYGTVDKIEKQSTYKYSDENTREEVEKKSLKDEGMIDDSYFTLQGTYDEDGTIYEKGNIIGQTVPAGTEYDQTNPPNDTELKIEAIGTVLEYKGKTGKQFCEELSNLGFGGQAVEDTNGTSMEQSSSVGNRTIISVKVYKATEDGTSWDTSEELKEFQVDPNNDKNVYFVITVKAPETQAPAPTPSYDGGGSYSAPSSGGSSGGGSSHNPGRGFDN